MISPAIQSTTLFDDYFRRHGRAAGQRDISDARSHARLQRRDMDAQHDDYDMARREPSASAGLMMASSSLLAAICITSVSSYAFILSAYARYFVDSSYQFELPLLTAEGLRASFR